MGSLGHPGGILCGICTTCDGPHVTRDTRVGLVAGGCPRGWLGSWVLSLAYLSTLPEPGYSIFFITTRPFVCVFMCTKHKTPNKVILGLCCLARFARLARQGQAADS